MGTFVSKRAKELGLKTIDASKDLVIEVVQNDIDKATRKNSKCCAFANAAKRQFEDVKAAYFFRSTAWLEYEDKLVRYLLPPAVQKEIVSFDRAHVMEPGTYRVNRPSKAQRLDGSKFKKGKSWANRSAKAKANKGKKKVPLGPGRKVRNRTKGVRSLYEPADVAA
jgi:hypothetical protein